MTIFSSCDDTKNLTIFTVEGSLTFDEQITTLQEFYSADPTANVLWDFRGHKGNRISSEEVQKIISLVKSYGNKRPKGKIFQIQPLKGKTHIVGKLHGPVKRGVMQQNGKLFATHPCRQVPSLDRFLGL
jgi:hypothetical protein